MRLIRFFLLITMGLSAPTYAITDQERAVLHRLYLELNLIEEITGDAEQAINPMDRRQFDYQSLRADLEKIQQGILDTVNSERREPRSLPPIEGEY